MKTVSGFVWSVLLKATAVVMCAGLLAACGSDPPDPRAGARVVHVIAAENTWGDIAAQVGGRHAAVASIIGDPSADPHLYSSNPRDAGRLAQANLVIVNGLGYDAFASKLLAAAGSDRRRVLTLAGVMRADSGANPHLWYDVPRVPLAARAIASAMAGQDPRDRSYFEANAARFARSLLPVMTTLHDIRARHGGAPVAYTERVAGYLLQAAGLSIRTPPGFARAIESGSEPGPADTQRLEDLIAHRRIRALLYNAQAASPITKRLRSLALRSRVPVVAVTESLPRGERSYQSWQLHQARALRKALDGR
jgi:zinc/manganese transport system substrate-binding protein